MENSQPTPTATPSPTSLVLVCKENLFGLDAEDEEVLADGYDEEYIKVLLDREIGQDLVQKSWIEGARLEGINYILRKREVLGFGFRTAYVSVSYLDRFLSIREVEEAWSIRLLAMGCLSLAAKMEEIRVPPLSELCGEDYLFESSVIQRMELLVLSILEWKMGSVTPFDFIHLFAHRFCGADAFSRLILGALRDAKIMCHRASVVAAAAAALLQGLTTDALEIKLSPLKSTYSLDIESMISCYGLLQEMETKAARSPDLSPMHLVTYGSSSLPSAKRRRLVFNQNDTTKQIADS